MKEDVFEQLVDDYLQFKGYFTRHNIKFRPSNKHRDYDKRSDSNFSDIDVIGMNPTVRGVNRVWVVSCKSWQGGFNPTSKISDFENGKQAGGREAWKAFREITSPKWAESFIDKVESITGTRKFIYFTAVIYLRGEKSDWESYMPFQKMMNSNPVRILSFEEILDELYPTIDTTIASSEIGRVLQLIKASRWRILK